jgi:membrane protein YqaA with SNARE-associated domain
LILGPVPDICEAIVSEFIQLSGPYWALFTAAFLAATLLPAQSELLLAALLMSGRHDWSLLLLTATMGNSLGSCVNWLLGRSIERFRDRRWFPVRRAALERAEAWYRRWGIWSLLLSWVPVIGDPLTLAAGLLRAPFLAFLAIVVVAKGGRYLAIALALSGTGAAG